MGTFAELMELNQTPSQTAPELPKTVVLSSSAQEPTPPIKPGTKSPRKAQAMSTTEQMAEPTRMTTADRRRKTTRGSFEVYQDQHDILRQVSLQAKLIGDELSISEMVREALDEYIHRKDLRP